MRRRAGTEDGGDVGMLAAAGTGGGEHPAGEGGDGRRRGQALDPRVEAQGRHETHAMPGGGERTDDVEVAGPADGARLEPCARARSHDHVMARGTGGREDPGRISQRRQLDRPAFVVLADGGRRRRRDDQDRLGEQLAHVDAGDGGRDEVVRVDHHDVAGAGLESAQSFCRLVLLYVDHEPGMAIAQGPEDPGEKRSCEGREHAEPDRARHHGALGCELGLRPRQSEEGSLDMGKDRAPGGAEADAPAVLLH